MIEWGALRSPFFLCRYFFLEVIMGKLAKPSFQTGPDDELAVVDVYEKDKSEVVNSYQEKDNEAIEAVDKAIEASADDITKDGNDDGGGFGDMFGLGSLADDALDIGSLLGGFGGLDGGLTSLLGGLGGGDDLFGSLGSLFGGSNSLESLSSIFGGDLSSLSSILGGGLNPLDGLTSLTNLLPGSNLPFGNLLSSLSSGNLDVLSQLGDLPSGLQKIFGGGMGLPNNINTVVSNLGSININSGFDSSSLRNLSGLISSITGNPDNSYVQNDGALSALIAGVSYLGNKAQLPNVYKTLTTGIDNPSVLIGSSKPLIQQAVIEGDASLLMDVCYSPASQYTKQIMPNVISQFFQNFKIPNNLAQQEYSRYYQNLKGGLNNIDPVWDTVTMPSGTFVNASNLSGNIPIGNLIQAQVVELRSPNNYLSNLQSVYPQSNAYSNSQAAKSVTTPTLAPTSVDPLNPDSAIAQEIDFNTLSTAVVAPSDNPTVPKTTIQNFDNEPYLLLGREFKNVTVNKEISRCFPLLAQSMSSPIYATSL